MSAPTDQFAEIAARTQDAVTTAFRTWADTLQSAAAGLNGEGRLPDVSVVVDRCFDFAEQALENQRAFAHTVLSAGSKAARSVTEQTVRAAQSVTAHTVNAGETVVEQAEETSQAAGEQAAATARAARNATTS